MANKTITTVMPDTAATSQQLLVLDEMALMKSFVGRSGRRIGGASRMHGHGSVQTMSTLPTH